MFRARKVPTVCAIRIQPLLALLLVLEHAAAVVRALTRIAELVLVHVLKRLLAAPVRPRRRAAQVAYETPHGVRRHSLRGVRVLGLPIRVVYNWCCTAGILESSFFPRCGICSRPSVFLSADYPRNPGHEPLRVPFRLRVSRLGDSHGLLRHAHQDRLRRLPRRAPGNRGREPEPPPRVARPPSPSRQNLRVGVVRKDGSVL
mmetsp:Transcript_3298/g.7761  ORF Transcript_3298/g.7761 Transcript_3298/m.7761 type:complete len:202 (+) Transcript_3298:1162-1767(+)